MSVVDSRRVFSARFADIGLPQQIVRDLINKGWDTYANFAACVPTLSNASDASGQSFIDNVITPILGEAAHVDAPKLRQLAFESYTMNSADLKRRVGSSEGDAPKKRPSMETARRLDREWAMFAPLFVENQLSHALDSAAAQSVGESRLVTRIQEVQRPAENAPLKAWKADKEGVVREAAADLDIETKVASDLDSQDALVTTVTKELPRDCQVEPVLNMPAVQWLLMPRHASSADSDPSAGRPAEKRRRAGEEPALPPPGPATGRQAKKKASKPKGAGKAQKAPMLQKFGGGAQVGEDGKATCFSYNLGHNCSRVHVCSAEGCFCKIHTSLQHKH